MASEQHLSWELTVKLRSVECELLLRIEPPYRRHRRRALSSDKPSPSPTDIPKSSDRLELNPEDLGFTLKTDDDTLKEIDALHEEAIKAAQAMRKFAWR